MLTTSNDTLDHADIDYLETTLIFLAEKTNHLDCDNKNKGNKIKVKKFREVELQQYLEEALFLMELIGISVFKNKQVELTSCLITSTGDINFVFYDNQSNNFYRFINVFVKDKDNNLKPVNCYGLNQEQQYYNRQMR